jgi:hypothetical protein
MRRGLQFALLAACLGLAFPGSAAAAEEPVYDEAAPGPVYTPAGSAGSQRIRFNGLRLNRRNGSAVLFVRVPGPGRVILKGRGVRRLARGAPGAKIVRLPIKPKVRLRRFLKRHGKGRIRVEVTFKPTSGIPRTLEKVIVLRRQHR